MPTTHRPRRLPTRRATLGLPLAMAPLAALALAACGAPTTAPATRPTRSPSRATDTACEVGPTELAAGTHRSR